MKIQSVTSKSYFLQKCIALCLIQTLLVSFIGPVFAITTSDSLEKSDILKSVMNLYSLALDYEDGTTNSYMQEAFTDFSVKVNTLIKKDPELNANFTKLCPDCDPIVQDTLDTDERLMDYLIGKPESAAPHLWLIISSHFHPTIKEKIGINVNLINTLEKKAREKIVDSIRAQVKEQTSAFRDVAGMGLYYDWNTDNSPYDLLDDIRRIDEIFFREAPKFGKYTNTSSDGIFSLISGKSWTGSWGGGDEYNFDLTSDIKDALGGGDDSEGDGGGSSDGEVAGDCDSWFCIEVKMIENTHYFLWGSGSGWSGSGGSNGKNSFQWIFEEWLEWLIKHGDNRNFACKSAPTKNVWESEFDLNILLKKVFSGASIFIFWKVPPFMKWYFDRNKKNTSSSQGASSWSKSSSWDSKATAKAEQQVLDSLERSFRRYDLDFEKPTNLKASEWQLMYAYAVDRADRSVRVLDTYESINFSKDDYKQKLLAAGSSMKQRPYTQEQNVESIKHLEKAFDEFAARTRMLHELVKLLKKILDYLDKLWECQPN